MTTAVAVPAWTIVAGLGVFVATLVLVNILLFGQSHRINQLEVANGHQARALANLSKTVQITPADVLKGFVCGSGLIATGGETSPAFKAELRALGLPADYCRGYRFPR